mmetsp:Transcript_73344/g.237216  ORF Transcript_73344/g.237216 Transcript_73344/m.237216 type:complete len:96 (+) Transcript_73344:1983-2270(+)
MPPRASQSTCLGAGLALDRLNGASCGGGAALWPGAAQLASSDRRSWASEAFPHGIPICCSAHRGVQPGRHILWSSEGSALTSVFPLYLPCELKQF